MAWLQFGKTILLFVSMQIPHSSSLSTSNSEQCLRSSSSFLLYLSRHTAVCFLSSESVTPLSSCSKDGYITADHKINFFFRTQLIDYLLPKKNRKQQENRNFTIELSNACFSLMSGHGSGAINIYLFDHKHPDDEKAHQVEQMLKCHH